MNGSKTKKDSGFARLAALQAKDYAASTFTEVNHEHHDLFQRGHERRSVELCAGVWCSFITGSDLMPQRHADRETAKAHVRAIMTRS